MSSKTRVIKAGEDCIYVVDIQKEGHGTPIVRRFHPTWAIIVSFRFVSSRRLSDPVQCY